MQPSAAQLLIACSVAVSYADTTLAVREQAKMALFACGGQDGRKMYENSQLFAHGFQGLTLK